MKAGDLVTYVGRARPLYADVGLVVETGVYPGGADVLVLWTDCPEPITQRSEMLKVINESR